MSAGAFIAGCAGPVLGADERAFFAAADPFGFILFARNIEDPEQLRGLTCALRDAVGRDAPILIDQEGGRVQRMGPPFWREWGPALDQIAQVGPGQAARSMYLRARLIAAELAEVGIDTNCAPLADLARPETHPILKNRCYGSEPVSVIGAARATAEGLLAGGVLPVLKHIPGHGRASVDSHVDLPRVSAPRATLEAEDFVPFRALADLPFAMTAHIVFDAVDEMRPITTSPEGIALIRDGIGFDGFLMSDDISMQALTGPIAARCVASLRAGCDAILHCNGDLAEMEVVAEESGVLSRESAVRAARALVRRHPPEPFDIRGFEAELEALLQGTVHG
ncbi:beta-N-acetylhexosaminidase [Rhodovulum bhavnagarense]|uniref:beta-N-acetylhexosaminidase n=1 Tax=Rhodovulum bhavnagarense TaxID=992286 RepID=A0A4R2RGV6_9RHOB|nr:glycoside hydrolase family 3 N-terminal domain-containing protein [Rhodovulum bhavnagarense]TCP61984.1 beta-N-acetylhexosaminidase [Rhodovulum bhavnagarense]